MSLLFLSIPSRSFALIFLSLFFSCFFSCFFFSYYLFSVLYFVALRVIGLVCFFFP